jgi:hypothetical protein
MTLPTRERKDLLIAVEVEVKEEGVVQGGRGRVEGWGSCDMESAWQRI